MFRMVVISLLCLVGLVRCSWKLVSSVCVWFLVLL